MPGCNGAGKGINSYALVSYLSDPLAGFLDSLRCELTPSCHFKSHVTVLPPRPLSGPVEDAWRELSQYLEDFHPFRLELGKILIFPETNVIYLSVGAGGGELERMHARLNNGRLRFAEPFEYHPHITLAQDLDPDRVKAAEELAARRWSEFPHARHFTVDELTFVQNTIENRWTDLAAIALSSRVAT